MQETVVDGVTGIAVDCGDAEALAEAAVALLRDRPYAAAFVARAAEHVRAYDVHRHALDVEAVYREVA